MTFNPGIIGSINMIGKAYAALGPAETTANSDSGYVFSTASTTQLGPVTVTKRTGGGFSSSTNPSYNATTETMSFNGTNQAIAYLPNADIQVAPLPFSFQIDFNMSTPTAHQYLVNLGQGNGVGWPCWQMSMNNNSLVMIQATEDGGNGMSTYPVADIQSNTWYRCGVMYYRQDTTNYLRVYLNNVVKVQETLGTSDDNEGGQGGIPRTTSLATNMAGITFGNDGANATGFNFHGQMRNIYLDHKEFWTI